jgi:ABC-type amino acid transport substrate-binding protein
MYFNKYLIALLLAITKCVDSLELRGVTIVSPPFVRKVNNDHFEGYAIDLLNEISRIASFNYTLYPTPDETYGQIEGGRPTGMIQEVFLKRADFAIADLTKTPTRERYVDFTDSYMNLDLSALIRKDNKKNMTSFEDLANQQNITYGAIRESATYRFMSTSNDPIIRRIHGFIYRNAYNLVNSRQEGIEKTLNSNYAFIQESVANEYAMDQNCELTVIDDEKEYYPREYAIGLQKLSPHMESFNKAIRQLKETGKLEELKRRYWNTKCLNNSLNARLDYITSMSCILSALISLILFH